MIDRSEATAGARHKSQSWTGNGVKTLYPGYFALVMATGIVSNAFWLLEHHLISNALFAVNIVAYPVLLLLSILRLLRFPRAMVADLINPRLVFSFFTLVAASDVFGTQFFLRGVDETAAVLWVFALVLWVGLSYHSFSVMALISRETGAAVVHGGWLIAIVGTESLVLLGSQLAPKFGGLADLTFLTIYALWGIGIVLYGIFLTLFSYRIFFSPVDPEEMNPLFWVVMGAAAIATNAGSNLIITNPGLEFLGQMKPFVEGTTLVLWAWATWLIPLFVGFGVWRHLVHKVPLTYSPMYWSLVFPLGMYSVATYRLTLAADFSPVLVLSRVMIWVALFAWVVTFTAMIHGIWHGWHRAAQHT